jgi:hypothetical protein
MTREDDLLFIADVQHDIERPCDAVSTFKQFCLASPVLTHPQRAAFIVIFKSACDPMRENYRKFTHRLSSEIDVRSLQICDAIKRLQDQARARLISFCTDTIAFIRDQLLPESDGYEAQAFYHKFEADLLRYIVEVAEPPYDAKFVDDSKAQYLEALAIAKNLPAADPTRLGVVLNYGVLLVEHLNDPLEAVRLGQEALEGGQAALNEIDLVLRDEAQAVLDRLSDNLEKWRELTSDEYSGEDT